jgi:hypothetical protein
MAEKTLSEIKKFINDMATSIFDSMQIKGISRMLIENQLQSYLDDKENDIDIEIAYYTLLQKLKEYGIK